MIIAFKISKNINNYSTKNTILITKTAYKKDKDK